MRGARARVPFFITSTLARMVTGEPGPGPDVRTKGKHLWQLSQSVRYLKHINRRDTCKKSRNCS